jgi:predicted outer membrane lipoprotein
MLLAAGFATITAMSLTIRHHHRRIRRTLDRVDRRLDRIRA